MSSGREEGEIDSEEDGLRKRINELEEENAEYEKIRRITECYADKYGNMYRLNDYNHWEAVQRAGQVPTDASSISSDEFPSPKKKKHKRNKKNKCRMHEKRWQQQQTHRCTHQRHKHYKYQIHGGRKHRHHRERHLNHINVTEGIETISLDSTENSEYEKDNYSIATMEIESADENDGVVLPLSREELRLALGRNTTERKYTVCPLKTRLQPEKAPTLNRAERVQGFEESTVNSNEADNVVEIHSDNSMSAEERELRLIALRSAIMRKHATRKKRNAEVAYSPTDFEELLMVPVSSVDSDIEELEGDMEISPASSPKLILSPIQYEYDQNSNISLDTVESQVDNKPVDMDIANSDSEQEDSLSNAVNVENTLTPQTHDIPLPPGVPVNGITMPISYNYADQSTSSIPFDMYVSETAFKAQMDMSGPILSLPLTATPMQSFPMPIANQDLGETDEINRIENEIANGQIAIIPSPKCNSINITPEDTQEPGSDDTEEEEALRALLLSQRQTAKGAKSNGTAQLRKCSPIFSKSTQLQAMDLERVAKSKTTDPSTQLAPSNVSDISEKPTPTESILKEAVRRLKIKTFIQSEDGQENVQPQDGVRADTVPRLKIKAFARCREMAEDAAPPSKNTDGLRTAAVVNLMDAYNNNDNNPDEDVEIGSGGVGILVGNPLEVLNRQSNANQQNVTTTAMPNKRRAEMDPVKGRTLRVIELKQLDGNGSQNPTQLCNSDLSTQSTKTQIHCESQIKKPKLAIMSALDASEGGVVPLNSIEHFPERANQQNVITTANGERQNGDVSSNSKSADTSNVASKTVNNKHITKANKTTEKGILSPTAATMKTQTANGSVATKTAAPSKISKPLASALKIVKPNKVINTSLEVKRNNHMNDHGTLQKISESANQSRILTSSTLPNIKVKRLIIRIGDSDSSSDDADILRNQTLERCIHLATTRTSTPDSLTGVLNENVYGDKVVAANSSLTESQTESCLQAADETSNTSLVKESVDNESFETKLENFLRNVRSKVQQKSKSIDSPRVRKISGSSVHMGTPMAVRSLPMASQEEYKRLVQRMRILEKQKQLKKMQKRLLEDTKKYTNIKKANHRPLHTVNNLRNRSIGETAANGTQTSRDAPSIDTLSHEQNAKVELSRKASETRNAATQSERTAEELYSCETTFVSISNNIIAKLDKSLELVDEAKLAKIAKLRHAHRLKELRLEMENTQRKLKEEQDKISRLYPEICTNNELITKLKHKRTKVLEMAMRLGKTVKGDDYRLNNDFKNEITLKSKGLATHIKFVNSIRYCDLDVFDKATSICTSSEQQSNAIVADSQYTKLTNSKNAEPSVTDLIESANAERSADDIWAAQTLHDQINTANCTSVDIMPQNVCEKDVNHENNTQQGTSNCDVAIEEIKSTDANVETPTPYNRDKEELRRDDKLADCMETLKEANTKSVLRNYISPLAHLRTESGKWDPNDIICPYELMGQCEDKDCNYTHLTGKSDSDSAASKCQELV